MVRKTTPKTTSNDAPANIPDAEITAPVTTEPVKKTKRKDKVVVADEITPAPVFTKDDAGVPDVPVDGDVKKRVTPTKESVLTSFEDIILLVDTEIETSRDKAMHPASIKFLRSLSKKLKCLRTQTTRVIGKKGGGKKPKGDKSANTNSGFLKPVAISSEFSTFAGWGPSEMKSRVDVTNYLCSYIKEHKLQNEKDKRQINPDDKLAKLLSFDEKTAPTPLTYFHLQKLLKPHFPKVAVA